MVGFYNFEICCHFSNTLKLADGAKGNGFLNRFNSTQLKFSTLLNLPKSLPFIMPLDDEEGKSLKEVGKRTDKENAT